MANRTVKDAHSVKGTNPQYLVEKIIRSRIYDSRYWKEECFALTAELLVDKAMELKFIGGVQGGNIKPAPFLCLVLKMLQIQPEKDIVVEFIRNEDFKYVRALGAFYMRLVGTSLDCYKYLEPLYNDYRKIKRQKREGNFEVIHMDEFIDEILREERICDVILPRIQKRHVLENNNDLDTRISALEDDLDDVEEDEEEIKDTTKHSSSAPEKRRSRRDADRMKRSSSPKAKRSRSRSPHKRRSKSPRRRSRSRDRRKHRPSDDRGRENKRHRSRSKSPSHRRTRDRDHRVREDDRHKNQTKTHGKSRRGTSGGAAGGRERDRGHSDHRGNTGARENSEIAEANNLRAKLGIAPLRP